MTCVRATDPNEALATRPPANRHKFFRQTQLRFCRSLRLTDKRRMPVGLEQQHHEYSTTSVPPTAVQRPTW